MTDPKKKQYNPRQVPVPDESHGDPICVCEAEPRWEAFGEEIEERQRQEAKQAKNSDRKRAKPSEAGAVARETDDT